MAIIGHEVLKESLRLVESFFIGKQDRINYAFKNAEKDELTVAMSVKFSLAQQGGIIPKLKYKFITDMETSELIGNTIDENQYEMFDENGEVKIYEGEQK